MDNRLSARSSHALSLTAALLLGAGLAAQNTQPDWSTLLGGTAREEITVVRHGPGTLVTIAGFTQSTDLPVARGINSRPFQTANAGGYDVFVARFDPTQPPATQMLFCTYLGGSGDDFAFDMEVDPQTAEITLVGLTASQGFPAITGQPPLNGAGISDGFLARFDATGSQLRASMLVGGNDEDRLCAVELERGGTVAVSGITRSSDLPWTAGTAFPTLPGGASDGFVARIDLSNPTSPRGLWATYVGGNSFDGNRYSEFVNGGGWPSVWEGALQNQDLALDASGNLVLVSISRVGTVNAPTTPDAYQARPRGTFDNHLAVIDRTGSSLLYGTFFGGSQQDGPTCIERHPAGGFVVGGYTFSRDFPVTPGCAQGSFQSCGGNCVTSDLAGYVCHIDPALGTQAIRYATYFDADQGEDAVVDVAVETSGEVVVAGYVVGAGNFPLTPRSMQSGPGSRTYQGAIWRLDMAGRGNADILYSTLVGGAGQGDTWFNSVDLDARGVAVCAGASNVSAYPQQNPFQSAGRGDYDGAITQLPLLPGCVGHSFVNLEVSACSGPLYATLGGVPLPGTDFDLRAGNAPAGAPGFVVVGQPTNPSALPQPLLGSLLVSPMAVIPVQADGLGGARVAVTVPAGLPANCPWGLGAQWLFLTTPGCPGTGPNAASARLDF